MVILTQANMAGVLSQESVIFADTSPENIAYAKEFWKAIDDISDVKSTLHVSGINHRLPTAPLASKSANCVDKTVCETLDQDEHARQGLLNNSKEAKRRLKIEEDEYVNRVLHQQKKQQDLLNKRKEERLQKEAIRETTNNGSIMDEIFADDEDNEESDNEAMQAMNDIDDFERMVKSANERRKEI